MTDSNPTIRLAVNGAMGRMGRYVLEEALPDTAVTVVAALEYETHPDLGRDVGSCLGEAECGVNVSFEWKKKADVLIDFSLPDASLMRLQQASDLGCAAVVATTGFTADQKKELLAHAQSIPIVLAANFSFGVNYLLKLLKTVAADLHEDFDIEIIEAHHNRKVDAPSGTAIAISEAIAAGSALDLETHAVYGRHGNVGQRPSKEIGIHTVRAGDIIGDHRVLFGGKGEVIEISHRALSRSVFASGAMKAAKFLAGKAPGLYSMRDVVSE